MHMEDPGHMEDAETGALEESVGRQNKELRVGRKSEDKEFRNDALASCRAAVIVETGADLTFTCL